jgi:hypothetical protein
MRYYTMNGTWPDGLRWLSLGGGTLPEGIVLPDGLETTRW